MFRQPPRISSFSGDVSKSDVGFESWVFEVKCLMKDRGLHEDLLLQSVRRSLKGEAGRLAMHLGEDATLTDILQKLDAVYGIVESGATLLQKFYNSKQEPGETVAAYGCRIEDILNKAIRRGAVARNQSNDMLKSKLWTGLRDERVRNATRYKYDSIRDFDTLRAELRAVEQEIKKLERVHAQPTKESRVPLMQQTGAPCKGEVNHGDNVVADLTRRMRALETKVKELPDNTKMLNKILEKVECLEKTHDRQRDTLRESSNSARPPPRDRR